MFLSGSKTKTKALLALFVAGGTMLLQVPRLQAQTSQAQTSQSEDTAAVQTPPQSSAPPYQLPPTPPQVSYADGQLEVRAYNSTIADVVSAIQNATGATIEGATASSTERIFGQFGPDSPNSVLGAVLVGSPYDFIIVGSEGEGAAKQHIILSMKGNPATSVQPVAVASHPVNNNVFNNGFNTSQRTAGVNDQSSYTDPQWSVPQYRYVPPANTQQPVQPGQFQPGVPNPMGQAYPGQGNATDQNNQFAQPGGQRYPGRPQHYGALYTQQQYGQQNPYTQPSGPNLPQEPQ